MKFVTQKKSLCAAVLFLFTILLATVSASAAVDETITKSFTVNPGGKLTLETSRGAVQVEGRSGNTVDVEIIQTVRASGRRAIQEVLDNFQISFDQDGSDVSIRAEYKREGFRSLFNRLTNRLQVKFLITVPFEYNVDLHTSGGSVSVLDLEGDAACRTSGGRLTFENITGDVSGRTSGGSIRIGEVKGNIFAHTSGGSIRVLRGEGAIDVDTSGGSITIEEALGSVQASSSGGSVSAYFARQPQDGSRLTTSGGSITVYLDRDIGVNVDARTSGGRIHTDFPVKMYGTVSPRSLNGELNGGGPELFIRTSGGGIHFRKK